MRIKRKIDGFIFVISSFASLLFVLLGYLVYIEDDMGYYNSYQYKMQKLAILDQEIENAFLRTYEYVNYDKVTKVSNEFKEIILELKKNTISDEFGETNYEDLIHISKLFEYKYELVEDFKSINSRLTNSMHYLYDLRRTILANENNQESRELVNQVFFQIGRLTMKMNINTKKIENDLKKLSKKSDNKNYKYFNKQAKKFIEDSKKMRGKLTHNKVVIIDSIKNLSDRLLLKNNESLFRQKLITFIFCIFSFGALFYLRLNYRKVLKRSKESLAFRYAVEKSDNVVIITNTKREIEYVNDEFEKTTGYNKNEAIGEAAGFLKSNMMSQKFYSDMNKCLDKGERWYGELINKKKDGGLLYQKVSICPMFLHEELIGFLSVQLDITDYLKQERKLKRSAIVFENTKDGILILDKNKKIISANKALIDMSKYPLAKLLKSTIKLLNPTLNFNINRLLRGKVLLEKSDKTSLPVWLTITAVYEKGQLINFIAIYTDLSEVIRTQERADFLKYHDRLTLLPNRLNFERAMEVACAENKKQNLSIMILELDKVSFINDSLGYAVGDKLLVNFSKLLYEIVPVDSLLGRWDGNKFILLLNMERVEITKLAKQILELIKQPISVNKHKLNVGLNIGISVFSDKITDARMLINYADIAMHHSKDNGSNKFKYYSEEIYINLKSRLNIERALQDAIKEEEFVLHYQPQYNLITKEVVSVETLIRWNSKKLGWVSPDDFIYIAEENGMIIELGFYIFKEACKAFMRWQDIGINLDRIAINVSSRQFREKKFLDTLQNIMNEVGIAPSCIEIELTESYIFGNSDENIRVLNRLRELGCHIAIDDFGTGYSSMSYLKDLPVDTVKIDRSFIKELSTSKYDKTVSKAIISLAHSLQYKVVAEGIETTEQEKLLGRYGCEIGQGFLFSKALDEDKLIEFIRAKNK